MPDLDKLHEHVGKLDALLRDREPGLSTWSIFVGEEWKAIAEMWNPERATLAAPDLLFACRFVKTFLNNLEDGTDPDDPLTTIRKRFHANLHAVLDGAISKAESAAPTASTEPSPSVVDQQKEDL